MLKQKQKKKINDDVPPLIIDGKTFKDYQNKANIFNTYFTTVTDKTSANNSVTFNVVSNFVHPLSYLSQVFIRPFPNIKLTLISTKEFSEIIKSLKWKNSHGCDEIPIKILKISLPYIISPLSLTHTHTHTYIYIYIYIYVQQVVVHRHISYKIKIFANNPSIQKR